ncbi:class III lanthionine synthetase LanKC [Microbacterium sp. CFBP 13617]|uniref:class III lanthionine synthetase LanKC n=1 Tax=Microbacterium sp. CFBP 13617 TaxID=2774035 RepID=UPI0017804C19|nr:class III lanthionine synthetase LanKC [Microbacterium sp. CFBP 13617]MBD8217366.1 class III lanthionine synthetase LanKC [Microbacterium sp. CFBP 13617]
MDAIYPVFARADQTFYDHPSRRPPAADDRRFVVDATEGWSRVDDGIWTYLEPAGVVLPEQGWKIHLSSTADTADTVLREVAAHCLRAGIAFKHLSTEGVRASSNAKDAGREGSGKFVTIYPTSIDQLHRTLTHLGRRTARLAGPHVLSDLRWREGPVFVRYGGFHRMFVDVEGTAVPAIRHPSGHLVADVRRPGFDPPAWAPVPPFLRNLIDELRDRQPPPGFPEITGVVQFSNAGGVYTARDDGREVIVKEARPHAGVTPDGLSAVQRADREARTLRRLQGTGTATLLREFTVLEHRYLVLERARGLPLHQAVVARHPLVSAEVDADAVDAYRTWALKVARRVERALTAVHAAGLAHGDVHPGNFLVDDDDEVTLIDFEMARPAADDVPAVIGAPGFVASDGRGGVAADVFALRRVQLFLFAPMTPVFDLHAGKEAEVRAWVSERFELRDEDERALGFARVSPSAPDDLADPLAAVARQLIADATPERTDRLWPGDPAQFDEPPYALAHGALGPLIALHAAGGRVPPPLAEWCERAVEAASARSGLFDGLAGAAAALQALGRVDAADRAAERCLDAPLRWDAPGLYGGPAGTALGLLRLADRHPELVGRARGILDEIADRANGWSERSTDPVATGAGGLLRGPSGIALLAMALFDRDGDSALLQLADAAIRADLARCTEAADGSLQMNEGWRLLPYLGSGSAGVALALAALVERDPAHPLTATLSALERASLPEFVLESGLFQGRAGLMLLLARTPTPEKSRALQRHRRLLRLHEIPRPDGVGYAGRALLRLSCDLATGSAGVLWMLASLRDGQRLALPFLDLPPVDSARHRAPSPGGR